MPNLSLGAKNDTVVDVLRKHLSPALAGRGWDALLRALAVGDQYKADLAVAAFEQSFKSTAGSVYLDRLLGDDGVTRPPGIGIGDESFRALGIKTTARKLLIQVILEVLETYYGSEATRAFSSSGTAQPFALEDGDDLYVEVDGQRVLRIVFNESSFTSIGAATALEVATSITRAFRDLGSTAYAQDFKDPETGDSYVRIFSGALGLAGAVRIIGGRAQNQLLFPQRIHTDSTGPQIGTTWNVTPGNGSNGVDAGRVRFTWVGGSTPDLQEVFADDYANIYGAVFASPNRGAFKILTGTTTYFEVENVGAIAQSGVAQLAASDLIFFRPQKRTIQSTGRMATATHGSPGTLEVILPATTQIVQRGENTGAYLHGYLHSSDITAGARSSSGVVSVTTSSPHGLTPGKWFFAEGIRPLAGSANEYVDSGDPTSAFVGTQFSASAILNDGRVLVCGGYGIDGLPTNSISIYTPATGVWIEGAPLSVERVGHTATTMTDGRVMVVGGSGTEQLVEIYDPSTDTWSPAASTVELYAFNSAVRLHDGRIMVIGDNESEIYNPATSSWSYADGHSGFRQANKSVVLDDGRVVVVGGSNTVADVYNPINNTWKQTTAYTGVDLFYMTLTRYRGGAVLTGGNEDGTIRANTKFLNPATLVWEDMGDMPSERYYHDVISLSDGTLLSVGGLNNFGLPVPVCAIYDPKKGRWTSKSDWTVAAQLFPYAVELASKNILIVGGTDSGLTPIPSELLISKYCSTYSTSTSSSGGLNGLFQVATVPTSTSLTFETPGFLLPTTFQTGKVLGVTATTNDVQGPFIYDPKSGVAVTGVETTISTSIQEGASYNTLNVDDASDFPDEEGWLCFGFGTKDETQPVHYLGRISNTILLLDPTYSFPRTLEEGVAVTLLKQRGAWTPSNPEEVGSFYVTAAASGRIAASNTIDEIVAAGVNVDKTIIYPSDKGLGNEGSPDTGAPKLSDRVAVWGGDGLDSELAEAREG